MGLIPTNAVALKDALEVSIRVSSGEGRLEDPRSLRTINRPVPVHAVGKVDEAESGGPDCRPRFFVVFEIEDERGGEGA